jgi:hypothetical protein
LALPADQRRTIVQSCITTRSQALGCNGGGTHFSIHFFSTLATYDKDNGPIDCNSCSILADRRKLYTDRNQIVLGKSPNGLIATQTLATIGLDNVEVGCSSKQELKMAMQQL